MRVSAHATLNGEHVISECAIHEGHSHVDTQRHIGYGLLFELGVAFKTDLDWSVWVDGAMLIGNGAHQPLRNVVIDGVTKTADEREVDWTFGGTVGGELWPPVHAPSKKLG